MGAYLLKIPAAAAILGISPKRAYELARQDRLPGLRRLGERQYRVARQELESFLGATVEAIPSDKAAA